MCFCCCFADFLRISPFPYQYIIFCKHWSLDWLYHLSYSGSKISFLHACRWLVNWENIPWNVVISSFVSLPFFLSFFLSFFLLIMGHFKTFKGILHPKMKILSALTLMSFQTHKSFVHLWNTNEDIFNETWEISVPQLKAHFTKIWCVEKS